jgi:peptidoglycan/LPS O-acetylase OafA/YrhL
MRTLDQQLVATDNRPSGFDYLRITLALCVVINHTVAVLHGFEAEIPLWLNPVLGPYLSIIVPAFFALSGFLVAGSLERNNLPSFLTLRVIRIFPALIVEVTLSALLIGTALTTLPLSEYFTHPQFHAYFWNVVGYIHYVLPGVFEGNPTPMVNAQLWTVPFELECYVAITILALLGARKYPRLMLAGLVFVSIAMFARQNITGDLPGAFGPLGGRFSVFTFLFGVALYLLRKKAPFNVWLFALALGISWALLLDRRFAWLSPLPITYMTVYLGLLNPRRIFIIKSADYSYGIYLYGFAIQQTVYAVMPEAWRVWYLHLPLSIAAAGVCAWFSWTFVEAPVMKHKKIALNFVNRFAPKKTSSEALATAKP